jgi:hypothetical protein
MRKGLLALNLGVASELCFLEEGSRSRAALLRQQTPA